MENVHNNVSSWNQSYNADEDIHNNSTEFIIYVVTCTIISVSLPLNLLAIYAVYSLVQKDNVAPIYIINLLISDLIQLCCMIVRVVWTKDSIIFIIFFKMYFFSLMASVGFMVCVALERYLVLAWPLWYRFRRTIKISLVVCAMVWALPLLIIITTEFYWGGPEITFAVYVLLPYPLLIFFLGGIIRALSVASGVPPAEKRRIVALLVLVLLIYSLLFLPTAIWCLTGAVRSTLGYICYVATKFSPFADLLMYVFLRRGAIDNVLTCLCCCRMDKSDTSRSTNG